MQELTFTVKEQNMSPTYGEFIIEPLETGYGATMGNALRRVLLTSIPGAAITSVRIAGVKHRFSTLPGLKENIVDLLLNVKTLDIALTSAKADATIKLSAKGPKVITAADLDLPDGVEVANKDHYIASLADSKAKLDIEMTVERGYGYSLADERKSNTLGVIVTDAIYSPIKRVNYSVEATRVGQKTNLDKLIVAIWTNGTVSPRVALDEAAKVLSACFLRIYTPDAVVASAEVTTAAPAVSDDLMRMTLDELDLPTRIYNSLRNGSIETIGDLLNTPKKELMTMRNMGGKSIAIIEEKLRDKGITLAI